MADSYRKTEARLVDEELANKPHMSQEFMNSMIRPLRRLVEKFPLLG
jgi:hypothetical protein